MSFSIKADKRILTTIGNWCIFYNVQVTQYNDFNEYDINTTDDKIYLKRRNI